MAKLTNFGAGLVRPHMLKTAMRVDSKNNKTKAYPWSLHEELKSPMTIDGGNIEDFQDTFSYVFYRTLSEQRGFVVPGLFDFSTVIYAVGLTKNSSETLNPVAQEGVILGPAYSYIKLGSHINRLLSALTNKVCESLKFEMCRSKDKSIYLSFAFLPKGGDKSKSKFIENFAKRLLAIASAGAMFTLQGKLHEGAANLIGDHAESPPDNGKSKDEITCSESYEKDNKLDDNELEIPETASEIKDKVSEIKDKGSEAKQKLEQGSNKLPEDADTLFAMLKDAGRVMVRINVDIAEAAVVKINMNDQRTINFRELAIAIALGLYNESSNLVEVSLAQIQEFVTDASTSWFFGTNWMQHYKRWRELPEALNAIGAKGCMISSAKGDREQLPEPLRGLTPMKPFLPKSQRP